MFQLDFTESRECKRVSYHVGNDKFRTYLEPELIKGWYRVRYASKRCDLSTLSGLHGQSQQRAIFYLYYRFIGRDKLEEADKEEAELQQVSIFRHFGIERRITPLVLLKHRYFLPIDA